MITYIPSVPIVPRRPHHDYDGGGTVVSVFLAIYIAVIVHLIIQIFKRLNDL